VHLLSAILFIRMHVFYQNALGYILLGKNVLEEILHYTVHYLKKYISFDM